MLVALLFAVSLFLAYANGANDNFKGVATLYGDGTLSYRQALSLATVAQIAGSLTSVIFAAALVKAFSGKGLVAPDIAASKDFLTAVGFGGAATVMLATILGFPISTTHALTGALAGTAFIANAGALDLSIIGQSFFLPLLLSPVLAVATAGPLYAACRWMFKSTPLRADNCLCIAAPAPAAALSGAAPGAASAARALGSRSLFRIANVADCQRDDFDGGLLVISAQKVISALHVLSAFALCFARGLNDTPKIVGIIFAAQVADNTTALAIIATAMALGGLLQSRKVAECMSKKVTTLAEPQALVANLVSSFYVIGASRLGVPVSTTHISVSAISGVGLVNGTANLGVIKNILLSWLLTLPIAAIIAMIAFNSFQTFGV